MAQKNTTLYNNFSQQQESSMSRRHVVMMQETLALCFSAEYVQCDFSHTAEQTDEGHAEGRLSTNQSRMVLRFQMDLLNFNAKMGCTHS